MDLGQSLRRHWREMRARAADAHQRAGVAASEHLDRMEFIRQWRWRNVQGIAIAVAVVILLIYPLAAWLDSNVDDNPDFAASAKAVTDGKSHAVANATALLNRELNKHGWTANAPWFWPTALLDNMPNYQTGIVESVARFASDMTVIGRARGAAGPVPALQAAAGLLHYPPDVWVWNPSYSVWPMATSASQYRGAMEALRAFNGALGSRQAIFDARAANLAMVLGHMAHDLDGQSQTIENQLNHNAGWAFDTRSDDVFYRTKGRLYGDYIVLKGLQTDFANAIASRNLNKPWADMMQSFRSAIGLRPWVVLNGAPDSDAFACTLCGEGFYVARAAGKVRALESQLRR